MEEKKMAKTCNNCGSAKEMMELKDMPSVPFAAHEAEVGRQERHIKRMWIALIVAVAMLFASNMGWLIYESQFETITYEQDGEGINNVNYGEQGDLNNGAESENQAEEEE